MLERDIETLTMESQMPGEGGGTGTLERMDDLRTEEVEKLAEEAGELFEMGPFGALRMVMARAEKPGWDLLAELLRILGEENQLEQPWITAIAEMIRGRYAEGRDYSPKLNGTLAKAIIEAFTQEGVLGGGGCEEPLHDFLGTYPSQPPLLRTALGRALELEPLVKAVSISVAVKLGRQKIFMSHRETT